MIEIQDPNERRIGPYSVVGSLARGATSEVLRAVDPDLNRTVAIKLLSPEFVKEADGQARFEREAQTVSQLNHPNVARMYEAGVTVEGQPYLVMEFVDGLSLMEMIRDKVELPMSRQIEMIIQSAEGLRAALAKGIIHRDIKPANVMVNREFIAKIVDFGLSKVIREDAYKSVAGRVMGTPRYMAPEVALGRTADYRSDIYSLAATLYHVLVGQPPFDGETPAAVMLQHVNTPLTLPYMLDPQIPGDVCEIIERAMAKDPNHRYQDYDEMIADLKEVKMARLAKEQSQDAFVHPEEERLVEEPVGAEGVVGDGMGEGLTPDLGYGQPESGEAPVARPRPPSYMTEGKVSVRTLPTEAPPRSGRRFLLIAVVLIVVAGGLFALAQPRSTGGRTGLAGIFDAVMARLGIQTGETPEEAYERQFLGTIDKLDILVATVREYQGLTGNYPRTLQDLVDEQLVGEADISDEFGTPLRFESATRKIRSAGPNGTMNDSDDFVMNANGRLLQHPPKPEEMDQETFTGVTSRTRRD